MIPLVTVPERPNGLPMAIAAWPGRRPFDVPSSTGLMPPGTLAGSTFSTATSVDGSLPTSLASSGLALSSPKRTVNALASSTTWSLVTM